SARRSGAGVSGGLRPKPAGGGASGGSRRSAGRYPPSPPLQPWTAAIVIATYRYTRLIPPLLAGIDQHQADEAGADQADCRGDGRRGVAVDERSANDRSLRRPSNQVRRRRARRDRVQQRGAERGTNLGGGIDSRRSDAGLP